MKRFLYLIFVIMAALIGCDDTGSGPAETVSAPQKPEGPEWLLWDDPFGTYTTGGAVSSHGHPVVYQFNWGLSFSSGWGPPERWTGWQWWDYTRKYIVRAQARCAEHQEVVSALSPPLIVTIEPFESVPPETWFINCPDSVIDINTFAIKWTGSDNETAPNLMFYSSFLEGYDAEWSSFRKERQRELFLLPDGDYTYYVRAMDEAGNEDTTAAVCEFGVALGSQCNIAVTRPAAGDVWTDSTLQKIEWNYSGNVYLVNIELYNEGEYLGTLAWSKLCIGEYDWLASTEGADSLNSFQLKLSNVHDPTCFAWSEQFTINPDTYHF